MVLIQLLLPARGATSPIADHDLIATREELIEKFGGLTAYVRAPAAGAWTAPHGAVERDEVVMVEVVTDTFDRDWWRPYVRILERRFAQEEIHVRALAVETL